MAPGSWRQLRLRDEQGTQISQEGAPLACRGVRKPVRLDALVGSGVSRILRRGAALEQLRPCSSRARSRLSCALPPTPRAAPSWEQFPRNATAPLTSGASSQPARWVTDSGHRQAEDQQGPALESERACAIGVALQSFLERVSGEHTGSGLPPCPRS